ncbi:MAG: hypothetical protein A2043_05590 [Candidatus Schekmanbacteria bacterium GWA2_38_9]|uniref:Uncharacterized protein n=1 Tax=Candidatus Schekmanbacteria bacterium RIFCSPLOWO2_12_FULL_38_15 TaxID=1817883 RepID=A0A1F7SCY6_9BACT|nr:MAG: hypothetical protein A2043_05590 [Candidatus Schekmanbacteria bacterium GWA2_38_9]OGL51646.1 MAG: hypothetical protein A3G31_05935 [Candidatus Schekmanbacteria bacterium RIFCSPLOWO2_12_FULL_38_15]
MASNRLTAIEELGKGMHALMDSTSPSHAGFQVWDGMLSPSTWRGFRSHIEAESVISYNELLRTAKLIRKYYLKYQRMKKGCN